MSVNNIDNGELNSSIREKLNELITIANHYSASAFVGGGGEPGGAGGEDPGAGGGGATLDSISLYSSGVATLNAETTSIDACNSISTGTTNLGYITKDAGNMNGTSVPEVNDFLYSDNAGTYALSDGYYGFYDMMTMSNKSIQVGAGMITSIASC